MGSTITLTRSNFKFQILKFKFRFVSVIVDKIFYWLKKKKCLLLLIVKKEEFQPKKNLYGSVSKKEKFMYK